ncbi:MAG: hypothetical protein WA364_02860 [Candidatus Nitrosopolaris sp.]
MNLKHTTTFRLKSGGLGESNNNFRYLLKNHIKPGIKTRRNSEVKSINCSARNISILRQQTNLKSWKRSVSYGKRWMVETVFSCINGTFGGCKKVSQHDQRINHKSIIV